ncbi:hypothetical protein [uncultured Roseobacter sp.]|uniref:hypothetical protein n=1 Tax=uncultured Roseobacter sp. TaxID=114847 RepID=UPI00260AAA49|nr:hypothetical protein [uncultured Roseobacter sp.]
MDNNQGMIGMALGSWLVALAGGVLAAVLLWFLGGWSFMQGAFGGVVVFLILGVLISWVMTRPLPAPGEVRMESTPTPSAPAPSATAPTPSAAATRADPVQVAPAPTVPSVKPSKRLPGQEELAARKGSWKYEKEAEATPGAAKKAPAKKAPAKKAAAKKADAPAAADARPSAFSDAARDGGADDLKKISGVGPKLEETLNSLGIWHFDQVASLKKKDIAWVDERLRFKGRIERDDWVGQAKKLAKGES